MNYGSAGILAGRLCGLLPFGSFRGASLRDTCD